MHHDHTFVYADEVKKYKTHHLTRPGHSKTSDNDENAAFQEHKGKESLVNKCIRTIAVNFDKNPNIDGLPEKLLPKLVDQLSLTLPVNISAAFIHSESYWKRCCIEGNGWKNCQIAEHGLTWKQTFFEKFIEEQLETFDPNVHDIDELRSKLEAAEDYVFNLTIKQLMSHMDLSHIFSRLPNLSKLELTYGVKQIKMNYERSLFGMKISDADSLKQCIKTTDVLTTLMLPANLIDDDLLRQLMGGLINNSTITHLDFSHNKITNHGARLLAKLLGSRSVLTCLNLADNQIHAEGGKYLGRALRRNESLIELNLRLNRLTDNGGKALLQGLRDNGSLQLLNLSANSLAEQSADELSTLFQFPHSALAAIDLSNNELNEPEFSSIESSLSNNMSLTSLDLRNNRVSKESDALDRISMIVRKNELDSRK